MPIYAYRCGACGHAKDVLQKLSDPMLSTCPACGAQAFSKQLTAAGFQLKGSGWYATDFKSSGAAASATKPAESGAADKPAESGATGKPAESSTSASGSDKPAAGGCGASCACH